MPSLENRNLVSSPESPQRAQQETVTHPVTMSDPICLPADSLTPPGSPFIWSCYVFREKKPGHIFRSSKDRTLKSIGSACFGQGREIGSGEEGKGSTEQRKRAGDLSSQI